MGLYEKIYNVMCDSEGLSKDLTVGENKNSYKAVSEASVLNTIKPLLKKHRIILFPVKTSITEDFKEYQGKYGVTQRFVSTLNATYKIVDIDTGEYDLLETVGYGADSQDKGSGKAMTYAYKALIQKTFMLFSGEDTDNTHSDDITKKNTTPIQEVSKVTQKELTILKNLAKRKGITEDLLLKYSKMEFETTLEGMDGEQYAHLLSYVGTKPDVSQ